MKKKKSPMPYQSDVDWYFAWANIRRSGPFDSYLEASEAAQGDDGLGVHPGTTFWCEAKK